MYIKDNFSNYTYVNKTAKQNEEIIASHLKSLKPDWTYHVAKKISVTVDKDCMVLINGTDKILIRADLGLNIGCEDRDISSFVMLDNDVNIYMLIGY